jgi:hypothetical protein
LSDAQIAERLTGLGRYGSWTQRQVRYHRSRTLQLPGNPLSRRYASFPPSAKPGEIAARVAVAHRGWGHLFSPSGCRPHVDHLTLADCDLLDLLTDGPAKPKPSRHTRRLFGAGLIVRYAGGFALAPGVCRKTPGARPNGIDLLIGQLKKK